MKILLVDDSPVILRSFSEVLAGWRHVVETASSFAGFLEALSGESFEVALLDFEMTRWTDFVHHLRLNHPEIKIILMVYPEYLQVLRKEALETGIVDVILNKTRFYEEFPAIARGFQEKSETAG